MIRLPLVIAFVLTTFNYTNASALGEAQQNVQHEFRFYRIQVYRTVHRQRPEFDPRRSAGEQALTAWKQAGGQAHQSEALIQWYRQARLASLPATASALPPLPEFPAPLAVAPQPEMAIVKSKSPRSAPSNDTGIYHVREVASRSIHHPGDVKQSQEQAKRDKQNKSGNTVWSSVSRALLRSIPLGGSDGGNEQ